MQEPQPGRGWPPESRRKQKAERKAPHSLGRRKIGSTPFDGDEVLLAIVVAEAAITALSLMLREQWTHR